jgi:integrase
VQRKAAAAVLLSAFRNSILRSSDFHRPTVSQGRHKLHRGTADAERAASACVRKAFACTGDWTTVTTWPLAMTREYLTTAEIERLMAAARKSSRYGHRDATMILIGYRHGLRTSELCDLQWSQIELGRPGVIGPNASSGAPPIAPQ